MKIKPEHLEDLRAFIAPLDTPERRAQYREGRFPNAKRVKNLEMRYRWDLLWLVPSASRTPLMSSMYAYMNDDHIDTALRSIVPPLDLFADVEKPKVPKTDSPIHDPWGLGRLN